MRQEGSHRSWWMARGWRTIGCMLAAISILAWSSSARAQLFEAKTIGSYLVGASDISGEGSGETRIIDMNDYGVVIGRAKVFDQDGNESWVPFVLEPRGGRYHSAIDPKQFDVNDWIQVLGDSSARVFAINNRGTIIGSARNAEGDTVGVKWTTGGAVTELDYIPRAINDRGNIVHGLCQDIPGTDPPEQECGPAIDGVLIEENPDGPAAVWELNDRGDVLGLASRTAVVWKNGERIRLDQFRFADAINDRGDAYFRDEYWNLYHWRDGVETLISANSYIDGMTITPDIDNLGNNLSALGVNDKGQIISYAGGGAHSFDSPPLIGNPITHLYLPEPDYGLEAGWHLVSAFTEGDGVLPDAGHVINEAGQFAGNGASFNFTAAVGYVASPTGYVPPPPPYNATYTAADAAFSAETGDPVNTLTGEFVHSPEPDLTTGGPTPLEFSRYYANGLAGAGASGELGPNWRHNWEWQLTFHDQRFVEGDERAIVMDDRGGHVVFEYDEPTDSWRPLAGRESGFQLDVQVFETRFYNVRDGRTYLFDTFEDDNRLVAITDHDGDTLTLSYDDDQLAGVQDGRGRQLTFGYDPVGQLDSVSDRTRTVVFGHDDFGRLTSVTDPAGRTTTYEYVEDHALKTLLSRIVLPDGRALVELEWDTFARVVEQRDGTGESTHIIYGDDNVRTIVQPDGHVLTHEHDGAGRLIQVTDTSGRVITMSHDASGRRASAEGASPPQTSSFDADHGMLLSQQTAAGATSFEYQTRTRNWLLYHDLTGRTFPDDTSESYSYDDDGRLLAITDRAGNETTLELDANGQITTRTLPNGGQITTSYDAMGNVVDVTDVHGHTTSYTYDAVDRLVSTTWPDGTTTRDTYEGDRLVQTTDELGHTETLEYDVNGRVRAIVDEMGHRTEMTHHPSGWVTSIRSPTGGVSSVRWDGLGRIAEERDPSGASTQYVYDARGELAKTIDAAGHEWTQTVADTGLVTAETDPLGNTHSYEYDDAGNLVSATDPLGNTAQFTWDAMGRNTSTILPDGSETRLEYDAMGRLVAMHAPGEVSASYERDAMGYVTAVTGPDGNTWQYERDLGGRVVAQTDPDGQVTALGYDPRGRVNHFEYPEGGTLDIAYDDAGRMLERAWSDGTVASFERDPVGRVVAYSGGSLSWDGNGDIVASNGLRIERDLAGRITSIDYGGGRLVRYDYDVLGQLAEVTDWLGHSISFTYDDAGRRTSATRSNGVTTEWQYDAAGRLVGITEAGDAVNASVELERDGVGRITSVERDAPMPRSANALSETPPVGTQTFDALGRRTDDDLRSYEWNLATRLLGIEADDEQLSFVYDGFGQVVERSDGLTARGYVWNHATPEPTVAVVTAGGLDLRYDIYTPAGELLYSVSASDETPRWYHFDETSSTTFLTDASGVVTDRYAYGPYGELLAEDGPTDNPYRWQGRFGVMSEGHGLYRMGMRVYDSRSARFISREPLPDDPHPMLLDPYQYAANDPMLFTDYTGRSPKFADTKLDTTTNWLGNAVGIGTKYGEHALKYLGKADRRAFARGLLRDSGILRGRGSAGMTRTLSRSTQQAGREVARRSKQIRNLNKVGIGAAVVGGALTAYKQYEQVKNERRDQDIALAANRQGRNRLTGEILRQLDAKLITPDQAAKLLRQANSAYDAANKGATEAAEANIYIHSLRNIGGAVASLIPEVKIVVDVAGVFSE